MKSCRPSYVTAPYPNEDKGNSRKRWQRSRELLSGSKYVMDGKNLSKNDNLRVSEMLILWAHVLQDISFRSGMLTRTCSTKSVTMWIRRLDGCDIKSVISTVKYLLSLVREYNPHNGAVGLKFFRQLVLENVRKEDLVLLEPVWSFVCALVRTGCEDVELFHDVNTLLQFPLRLTLHDVKWVEDAAIQDYLDFEASLTTQTYPRDLLEDMNREAREIFRDFRVTEEDFPVNGNGATAEVHRGVGESAKFAAMKQTWATHQMDNTIGFAFPEWLGVDNAIYSDEDMVSHYQLVPKGIDKKRGISLEPVTHMYYQHAVFQAMDRHFHQHPELNICLQRQEYNRELASLGSAILSYGTADLSSASDSVTITLVKAVFEGTPLLPWLLRTRTRWVSYTKKSVELWRIRMEKFAPMGSALCFPVECAIFSLIIRVASKRVGVDRYYRVYGDDMIIHRDVWNEALEILNALHFHVNTDKSFAPGSEFTESCGIECLNGADVSPMRISRKWEPLPLYRNGKRAWDLSAMLATFNSRKTSHRRRLKLAYSHMSPNQLEGQVEFLNRLCDSCLFGTAYEVYRDIRRTYGDVLLRDAEASLQQQGYRLSELKHTRLSPVIKDRLGGSTQTPEALVTTTMTRVDDGKEEVNYFLTLQTLARREGFSLYDIPYGSLHHMGVIQAMPPEMVTKRRSGSTHSSIVRRWVPMYC